MRESDYQLIEGYMQQCMSDSAHDREHVYRVLYLAMEIATDESGVDDDVLITACLLHDIARKEQFENPQLCHAQLGAEKAWAFLLAHDFDPQFAGRVAACIRTHRFRSSDPPTGLEARILFDADKLDVTGAVGIARTLLYIGHTGEPLYSLTGDGTVSDGTDDATPSFFQEYKYKLERLYSSFYTRRGRALAAQRQQAAVSFYESMYREVQDAYVTGRALLREKQR